MSEISSIAAGTVVTMHYKLALDDGEVVDSSEGNDPLTYLHGAQNIVPGLESEMEGKEVGSKFDVSVKPEEGYGPRHPNAVQNVPRGAFPDDAQLEPGIQFKAENEDQQPIMGTIMTVDDETVVVDFNHPLAGQTLNFSIEIVSLRAATGEEQEHGHVHGPGGHQH